MEKQNAISSLKESIRLLEIKQAEEGAILKEQFAVTIESLKPINLLKSTIKEMTSSVDLKSNLSETVISILAGYLTKKIMVNSKSGPFMKILGAVLQFGVTSVISQNADNIREFLNRIIDRFLRTKPEEVPETEV
jgi:uncharacterized membrane protein YeaQ/YmgE (transglycosylase-associated protein family)